MSAHLPPLDVWELVREARVDRELCGKADEIRHLHSAGLFSPASHDRHGAVARASDAGRCSLELWADLHDAFDVAEPVEDQLTRMDLGTTMGAWYAALFMAAVERKYPELHSTAEYVVSDPAGHVDVLVSTRGKSAVQVVEFKLTMSTFASWVTEPPPSYHIAQAAQYAIQTGAPHFTIAGVAPAQQKRKGIQGARFKQHHYATADYTAVVAAEYARLQGATGDAKPIPDPQQPWRCTSCRFATCSQNENPLREVSYV